MCHVFSIIKLQLSQVCSCIRIFTSNYYGFYCWSIEGYLLVWSDVLVLLSICFNKLPYIFIFFSWMARVARISLVSWPKVNWGWSLPFLMVSWRLAPWTLHVLQLNALGLEQGRPVLLLFAVQTFAPFTTQGSGGMMFPTWVWPLKRPVILFFALTYVK